MKKLTSKNLIFTLVLVFASTFCFSQENTSGTVVYEQVMKLDIKLEGEASQFAHMLPKERKSNKVLYFNQESSLYENKAKDEDETMAMSSGHGNVMIKMQEPENRIFTNLKNNKQVDQKEFMTRTFLIEGEINEKWKITGNQKMILDYPCQEAVVQKDSSITSVWFTPAIPVSAGPMNFGGLPGLILAVEADGGKLKTIATSVDLTSVDKNVLTKPKKGKKVTREEFDEIVKEKMKEMGAENKGGNQMIIRMHR